MKAFWTIVANAPVDGTNTPNIPKLPSVMYSYTSPCELWILPEGTGAAAHRHLLSGSFGLPSFQVTSKHTHLYIRGTNNDGSVRFTYQVLIHESQAQHTHPDAVLGFFMPFIRCSDADYLTLTSAPYNIRPIAHAVITQDDEGNDVVGDLEQTVWSTAVRNAWVSAAITYLGITLPAEVDRGSRLIDLLMGLSLGRGLVNERGLR